MASNNQFFLIILKASLQIVLSPKFSKDIHTIIVRINSQMCFFPVKCLKAIIFIGSICSIIISVGLLAMTVYVQVQKKDIISSANKSVVSASLIGLYISSIVFLLLGVAGLAGSIKSSKNKESKGTCLLALYSIGIFVFFVLFLGGTIFFFVGPEAIFGNDCTHGSKTTFIDDLYNTSQEAYGTFCQGGCGCAVDNASDLYSELKNSKQSLNLSGTAIKYADCPNITASVEYIEAMSAMQKLLKCGGWCSLNSSYERDPIKYYFYRFSNINDCNKYECYSKLENCHDAFYDFMAGKGKFVGFGCLAAMLLCFINIIALCCICFHPSKTGKNSNFYSRMIEMD